MPTVWRVTKAKYTRLAFSGLGAHLYGGRWNSKGRSVVYASATLAVAILEILIHLPHPRHLRDHLAAPVDIPDDLVEPVRRLPRGWRSDLRATQRVGDKWLEGESTPVLEVPSAVYRCRDERPLNYLLNPSHAAFRSLNVQSFRTLEVDPRIS